MNNFEEELNKIRVEIYEELKNLTNEESSKLIGERARKIAEQFNIRIIAETPMKAGAHDLPCVSLPR